ncbi:hypothetical protein E3N88_40486 [Mikania micrantha]|uniref:Uncharacterized protein n=1 Tax=Mikania micrantha TaxID=192012 RepID=A0A5N6LMV4_9ASTR|nr:hypothetical protein E3N88_40486 [Mikania micrantha]
MSIERFAMHLGIYYEPETILDDFTQWLTQGEEGVMRAWWAQISDTSFTDHRIAARCDETAQQMAEADRRRAAWEAPVERRLDRYEDFVQWTVASEHA